ncbi:MAG: FAD-dependent oxidoreductase [Actinomycetia bacterium]|nr:FAD-dependent oxidoreductase [Actinomycetes bacterium]
MTADATRALADVTSHPVWLDHPEAPEPGEPLSGTVEADLVIVGGGFTGLWAALQAKERDPDREITLIEADRIAWGASGRNGGIVSVSLIHGLSNGADLFPDELGRLEELGRDNIAGFRSTLERHHIDCHDEWNGELTVAVDPRHLPTVDHEYELHRRHGYDVERLDATDLRAQLDSPTYAGGVWIRDVAGTVHPAELAWGLARAALSLGVRIHEQTPMTGIDDSATNRLTVTTAHGAVQAGKAILATNAFAAGPRSIRRRVIAIRDRVVATEPLTPEQLGRLGWTNRQGVYDTRTQLNYYRLTPDNRVVFGGRVGYFYGDQTDPAADLDPATYVPLVEAFHSTFPQLREVGITHAWGGPIGLTSRFSAAFGALFDNQAVWAGGYSGFGVGTSRFGARVALDLVDGVGGDHLDLEMVTSSPFPFPPEPFRWAGARITMASIARADERGGPDLWLRFLHRLGIRI